MATYHYFIHAEVYEPENYMEFKGKISVVADYDYQIDADNYDKFLYDLYQCDALKKIIGDKPQDNYEIVPVSINLIATYI